MTHPFKVSTSIALSHGTTTYCHLKSTALISTPRPSKRAKMYSLGRPIVCPHASWRTTSQTILVNLVLQLCLSEPEQSRTE